MEGIIEQLIEQFELGRDSLHGPRHWRRVERYGLHLAGRHGGNVKVVRLFAYFHDCRRVNEHTDPGHGLRGARHALSLKPHLRLDEEEFDTLFRACAGHTEQKFSPDPTIGACWDADRLDLDRVGYLLDPDFFSTAEGKRLALLSPAARRSEAGIPH